MAVPVAVVAVAVVLMAIPSFSHLTTGRVEEEECPASPLLVA